jgi:hypothetical protein
MNWKKLPAELERWEKAIAWALACVILGVAAWHMPGWARIADKAFLHTDQFAGEGKNAMHELYGASIQSKQASQEMLQRVQEAKEVLAAAKSALVVARGSIAQIGELASQGKQTIAKAEPVLTSTDNALQAVTGILSEGTAQLNDNVGPLLASWKKLADAGARTLDDPELTGTYRNVRLITGSWAQISKDGADKFHAWLYPEKHPLTKAQIAWRALQIGKDIALPGAQIGYYLSNWNAHTTVNVSPAPAPKEGQ